MTQPKAILRHTETKKEAPVESTTAPFSQSMLKPTAKNEPFKEEVLVKPTTGPFPQPKPTVKDESRPFKFAPLSQESLKYLQYGPNPQEHIFLSKIFGLPMWTSFSRHVENLESITRKLIDYNRSPSTSGRSSEYIVFSAYLLGAGKKFNESFMKQFFGSNRPPLWLLFIADTLLFGLAKEPFTPQTNQFKEKQSSFQEEIVPLLSKAVFGSSSPEALTAQKYLETNKDNPIVGSFYTQIIDFREE
jgi:hypothetical protein